MVEPTLPNPSVGDWLPEHVRGPISRATLALFAGASNDHIPLHIDSDFAKSAGMPDVFAPGMLSLAYVAQLLTRWLPQDRLRSWTARFTAITPLYATVTCRAQIVELFEESGELRARVKIAVTTEQEVKTIEAEAIVAISGGNSA
jgi:acyl dehydratase